MGSSALMACFTRQHSLQVREHDGDVPTLDAVQCTMHRHIHVYHRANPLVTGTQANEDRPCHLDILCHLISCPLISFQLISPYLMLASRTGHLDFKARERKPALPALEPLGTSPATWLPSHCISPDLTSCPRWAAHPMVQITAFRVVRARETSRCCLQPSP